MKNYYIGFLSAFLFAASLYSQSPTTPIGQQVTPVSPGIEAPAIVSTKFASEYPNTPALWKKNGEFYLAEFVDNSTQSKKIVVLDNFGNIQYTQSELPGAEIPKPIIKYFKSNFPDEKVAVWKQEDPQKKVFYFSPMKTDTLRFDDQGRRTGIKR